MYRGIFGGFAALCLAASLSPVTAFGSEAYLAESVQRVLPSSSLSNEVVPFNNTDKYFEFNMTYHNAHFGNWISTQGRRHISVY